MNILFVFVLLFIGGVLFYLAIETDSKKDQEKEWYSLNLGYEFCAVVTDKVELTQKWGYGYLECSTMDKIHMWNEDSLNAKLIYNKKLRFINVKENGRIEFLVQGIINTFIGDSICISSSKNSIEVYRNGKLTSNRNISQSLNDGRF